MKDAKTRHYEVAQFETLQPNLPKLDPIQRETLWNLYEHICSNWQMLVGIRFKLLGFTPGVSILAITQINKVADFKIRIILSILGLLATLAIFIYELRNTQLHNDLISRARKIEDELGISTGQFLGRKKSPVLFIKHDVALYLIYIISILCWLLYITFTLFYHQNIILIGNENN